MVKIYLTFLILMFFNILSFAHPGPTDARGGHWDHSTGGHHYHNKTPYVLPKFKDSTSENNGDNDMLNKSLKKHSPKEQIEDKRFNFLF